MMQTEHLPHTHSSPSFSSYSSSETFAQIAARVIQELQQDPLYANDLLFPSSWPQNDFQHDQNDNDDDDNNQDDDEFEFSLVSRDIASSPVSADDIFHNGHITPSYLLFGRHVLLNGVFSDSPLRASETTPAPAPARRRLPLRALMLEEHENNSKNELEGVAEGSYCVWTPQSCKKSSSAGSSSSRRWKLRDLLLRSHSDGKEPILFINNSKAVLPNQNGSAAVKDGGERSKRRLFLPYRQEILGLFGNNNNNNSGVGRDSQPSSNPN
ncbi:hypothetical protein HN51_001848 [Arachis hypogaea]|uniref:Uncharacterized protein n=2 Tax=Arachis TaxID=3817 RepID=A0A445EQ44_ARAHY|nr:uncharacterized protein LOC107491733 [Arachis duranensis]XP_025647560.1 uncharacterized protein LOC112742512 [Arachis hypogaea]QHO49974.1 uncharacterized protein DS421_1g18650 [Arachis hypogaea]RYR77482.1 hypothetical protein Ahy_A01g001973 [Arachis hypogaea]